MSIIAKNVTASGIEIADLSGLWIPPYDQVVLSGLLSQSKISDSEDLDEFIEAGSIVINDGSEDMTVQEALDFTNVRMLSPYESFLSLIDTPATYSGLGYKYIKINDYEDGIDFTPIGFLDLYDAPTTYSGYAGRGIVVNEDGTAFEYTDIPIPHSFLDLDDTPTTYSGYEGKCITIKEGGSGLEYTTVTGVGVDKFIELGDTPTSYVGRAGQVVMVKEDELGLEYSTISGTYDHGHIPPDPSCGALWYNNNDRIWYSYDCTASGWLSVDRVMYSFSKHTLNFKNAYISYGETNQAATGPIIPRPASIIGIHGRNDSVSSGREAYLHNFTTPIYTLYWSNKNYSINPNLNVDPGTIFKIKAGPENKDRLDYPVISVEVAWRYDPTWDGTFPDGNDLGA